MVLSLLLATISEETTAQQINPASIDRLVQAYVDSGFAGVVLVAKNDAILLRRAYSGRGPKLSPDSRFWIASITKGFTAGTILELQSRGLLSVRDSLGRFFPDVPADKGAITVHQLLTHTAGFSDSNVGSGMRARAGATQAILSQPLAYAPGKGYRYGNDDYQLLAAIIEIVSHQSWDRAVKREILKPFRLKETGFMCDSSGPPDRVPSHQGLSSRCTSGTHADWGHRGSDGMSSTVDDLFSWSRSLRAIGSSKRKQLATLRTPQVFVRKEGPFDISYSYGARIYQRDGRVVEVMHSGNGDDGHTSILRELESGVTIIVLSNAGQHEGTTWASYVATRIAPRPDH